MKYWLIKSEPSTYSWQDMKNDDTTLWDGVRNYQARNNLMTMQVGDQCFFYHSNQGKEIVGIVEVIRTYYPDPTDESGKFVVVDVQYISQLQKPVTLSEIKSNPILVNMALVKHSRLSVSPVTKEEWKEILKMSES